MTGADAYVAVLKEWRIRHLFGLPGTTEAALLHALHQQDDVRYVLALSEGIAVGMADGYARAGGGPGVASLHTTVGVLGGLSILYNAWRDATPVVVTAANKHTRVLGRRGFTTTPDLPALAAPLAKWSWQSLNADQVGEDLDRALRTALSSPTGPVFLATPEDLLTAAVPDPAAAGWASTPVTRVRPEAGAVARAARLLLAAELPVLVLGSDVAVSGAVDAAIALAEALTMPVLWESFNALSAVPFPSDHPQFLGLFTPQAPVLAEADTVCAIGPRLFTQFAPPARPELPPGVPVIHAHRSSDEVGWIYPAAVGMQADAASALTDLLAAVQAAGGLPAQPRERRQAAIGRLQAGRSAALAERARQQPAGPPLAVFDVLRCLDGVLPRSATVVNEAGLAAWTLLEACTWTAERTLLKSGGGSLGWGLPAAVGAKLARPEQPVVAVVGDGSLQFTIQALWTAASYGAPVVVVVLNNESYQAVQAGVEVLLGRGGDAAAYPGTDLGGMDLVSLARGYGVRGVRIGHRDQVGDAVAEALAAAAAGASTVIDVPVGSERMGFFARRKDQP